jgi:acyl dehydratase
MIVDTFVGHSSSMGAGGIDEVKWLVPIRPGDELKLRATVLDTRASQSKPDRGFVKLSFELFNAAGARVLAMTTTMIYGRRHPGAAA